jgi:hypothetical protein
MGQYAYFLRSPKLAREVKVERPDKSVETIRVASFSFAFKPSFSRGDPKWLPGAIVRIKNIWGDSRPSFAAETEHLDDNLHELPASKRYRLAVGLTVYHWATRQVPHFMVDGDNGPGGSAVYGKIVAVL